MPLGRGGEPQHLRSHHDCDIFARNRLETLEALCHLRFLTT